MNKFSFMICISGFMVAIDQLTKTLVLAELKLGEAFPVIENFFHFTFVKNYGAAFGLFGETHPVFREWFFLIMPPLAMGIILILLSSTPAKDKLQVFALSSIMGGALGNYTDRWLHGYVVDFLDFHYGRWTWPTFNLADVFIVLGVGLLLASMLREELQNAKTKKLKGAL